MKELRKYLLALFMLLIIALGYAQGGDVFAVKVYSGTYHGDNVMLKNPYVLPGNKYCIAEIVINGKSNININANDIELDLSEYEKGTYINIEIRYHKGCSAPSIVNPNALRAESTYKMVAFEATENNLKWTTKNEVAQKAFIIEQKIYNKWVELGKVISKGTPGYNEYTFPVEQFSGKNVYRLKQKDIKDKYVYSEIVEYNSKLEPITFYPDKVENCIYLSRRTKYQIFTEFGVLVKQGEGYQIKLPNLESGQYYLYIDNRVEKIVKQ